jgi:hypothetical protein
VAGETGGTRGCRCLRAARAPLPGPPLHAGAARDPLGARRPRLCAGGSDLGLARDRPLPRRRPFLDLDLPDRAAQGLRRARSPQAHRRADGGDRDRVHRPPGR